jgi:hypothetical protein
VKEQPTIFIRDVFEYEQEIQVIKRHFEFADSRIGLIGRLVIGRYSVLPNVKELEKDLAMQGSILINTYKQHQYIANFDYYHDVEEYTPKTWFRLSDIPKEDCSFVLKGSTNSRKDQWKTKMFAEDYKAAVNVYCELANDSVISDQNIIIRRYVPLKSFGASLSGVPFANEWRLFFYKTKRIGMGYYWINSDFEIPKIESVPNKAFELADKVAKIISEKIDFFVLDIAETQSGDWILIEANDAQMCSLGGVDADDLYRNLRDELQKDRE